MSDAVALALGVEEERLRRLLEALGGASDQLKKAEEQLREARAALETQRQQMREPIRASTIQAAHQRDAWRLASRAREAELLLAVEAAQATQLQQAQLHEASRARVQACLERREALRHKMASDDAVTRQRRERLEDDEHDEFQARRSYR